MCKSALKLKTKINVTLTTKCCLLSCFLLLDEITVTPAPVRMYIHTVILTMKMLTC